MLSNHIEANYRGICRAKVVMGGYLAAGWLETAVSPTILPIPARTFPTIHNSHGEVTMNYNLTPIQKEVITWLVKQVKEGNLP
jgi:hypothetical protein